MRLCAAPVAPSVYERSAENSTSAGRRRSASGGTCAASIRRPVLLKTCRATSEPFTLTTTVTAGAFSKTSWGRSKSNSTKTGLAGEGRSSEKAKTGAVQRQPPSPRKDAPENPGTSLVGSEHDFGDGGGRPGPATSGERDKRNVGQR